MKKQLKKKWIIGLMIFALVLTVFNQFQLMSLKSGGSLATGITDVSASIMPTGTPKVYGNELGIDYDDVSANNPS